MKNRNYFLIYLLAACRQGGRCLYALGGVFARQKLLWIIPVWTLVLSACFSPLDYYSQDTVLTLNFGGSAGRAAIWDDRFLNLPALEHRVQLRGPSGVQNHTLLPGVLIANFDVKPGRWTIIIRSYLFGELYAEKTEIVNVKSGQNNEVTIQMLQAGPNYNLDFFDFIENTGTITGKLGVASGHVYIPAAINGVRVSNIGTHAFRDSLLMTGVTIPSSVTNIGNEPFFGCINLASINLSSGNTSYSLRDGVLYTKNLDLLIAFPPVREGTFTVPNSVVDISEGSFAYSKITGINFSNRLIEIGPGAFYSSAITSIIIPDSVTHIWDDAFSTCTSLESAVIGSGVNYIGEYAFGGCANLIRVTFRGLIDETGFSSNSTFPAFLGNLRDVYFSTPINSRIGTYTRTGTNWTKE